MAITLREHVVFDGHAGWRHGGVTYRLAVGGALAQAANGDLICSWLSGTDGEPAADNCLLCARSGDGGHTWSEPQILMPSGDMAGSGTILPAPTPDGKLVFLGARWPAWAEYTVWYYFRRESADDGHTWSEPMPLTLRAGDSVSVGGPVRLKNGRLLMAGSTFDRRETPLRGDTEALARAKDEDEAQALSARSSAPSGDDKFYRYLHGVCVFETDPDYTRFTPLGSVANRPLGLLEPTLVELIDGRLVFLMRAEYGGFLWRSDSADGGRTWCPAYQTDIRDPTSLASALRLPDGRIALIHNDSGGVVGRRGRRDPLSLWLSDDEMETWSVKADLLTGASFSYPSPLVTADGCLVFGYDLDRRQVRFVEVEVG